MLKFIKEVLENRSYGPLENFMKREPKLISGIISILFLGGGSLWFIPPTLKYVLSSKESSDSMIVQVPASATGGPDVNKLDGDWLVVGTEVKDGVFYLNNHQGTGRVEYAEDIGDFLTTNVNFVPYGEKAMNIEFSHRGIYRLVIGDNSYDSIGFNHKLSDSKWGEYDRKQFNNCKFGPNDPVGVNISENYIELENKFVLTVTLLCDNAVGLQYKDTFMYEFTPVVNWRDLKNVYFGLIDFNEGMENKTAVYFVSPAIANLITE